MDPVLVFLGAVASRVTLRAANDIGDLIYDKGVVGPGRALYAKFVRSAESGDETATQEAAVEYEAHLRDNQEELEQVVPAVMETVVPNDPMAVLDAITAVMYWAATHVDGRPPGAGAPGCLAFAGSFVSPDHVTVIDVRDPRPEREGGTGRPLPPRLDTYGSDEVPFLPLNHVDVGTGLQVREDCPRLWIVLPGDPSDRDALAADLNELLLSRKRPDPVVLELALDEVVREVATQSAENSVEQPRGRLRRVESVFADRVAINYPDPEMAALMRSATTLAGRAVTRLTETAATQLKRAEEDQWWVSDPEGPRVLVDAIKALVESDRALVQDRVVRWEEVGRGLGAVRDDDRQE